MDQKAAILRWYSEAGYEHVLQDAPTNWLKREPPVANFQHEADKAEEKMVQKDKALVVSNDSGVGAISSLAELRNAVEAFEGCALKRTAKNTVFGDGTEAAKIMLIGEAPGANEDEKGIPFCGQSGKLLDNILLSVGLSRQENVYITNTVFWRPPGNRRPTPQEIAQCKPFVEKHIALVAPKLIVLVGSTAVESLLASKAPMASLRGQRLQYTNEYMKHSADMYVIFHPSYLLRQSTKKKLMWEDMVRLRAYLKASA